MLALRNVTFMTVDPQRLAAFWSAALGWNERRDHHGEVLLADPMWGYPRLTFQPVGEDRPRPAPIHLDLTSDERLAQVRRLVALGAEEGTTIADEGEGALVWTVMRDPDGNEFCLTDASNGSGGPGG